MGVKVLGEGEYHLHKTIFFLLSLFILTLSSSVSADSYSNPTDHVPRSPEWARTSVIYQVYLRDFSPQGKLHNLENDILRIKNLGVNCIDLLPIHPTGSAPAGRSASPMNVKDFSAVSLEYGTKDGLKSLVEQAHFDEMKVILDWICDRASAENPLVKSHPDWFAPASGAGDQNTVPFDYHSKDLRKFVKDSLTGWLKDSGLDGFHFLGSSAFPADFLKEVRSEISTVKPSAVLFVDENIPQASSSYHLTEDLDFYSAVSSVTMGQAPASQIEAILDQDAKRNSAWPIPVRFIENFRTPRAAKIFGAGATTAAALLLTLDGVPLILSGQEIAETKQTSLLDKDAIDWSDGLKKNSETRKTYKKLIGLRGKHLSLGRGQKFIVHAGGAKSVFAFASSYREDAVLAAFNFSPAEFDREIDLPEIFLSRDGKINLKGVFVGGNLKQAGPGKAGLHMPPWGFQVWEIK